MSQPYDVFICHAGEDKDAIAMPIYDRLQDGRISIFLDKEELRIGGNAPEDMVNAMNTAPIGLFILSPEFAAKKWPMIELLCFLRRAKEAENARDVRKKPVLIPVFYRLSVADCRYNNPFKKYCQVLGKTDFLDRLEAGETDIKTVREALKSLSENTGIENPDGVTNESSLPMLNGRMELAKKVSLLVKSATIDAAYYAGSGAVFSNPVTAARALAEDTDSTRANGDDMGRSIKFLISNNTSSQLKLMGSHMACGKAFKVPDVIEPHRTKKGELRAEKGASGIKGALLYEQNNNMEKVCLFLENVEGEGNSSGIQYYWDTWKTIDWYFSNVLTVSGRREVKRTINNWYTIKSFVSNDDHATGAFVLETF